MGYKLIGATLECRIIKLLFVSVSSYKMDVKSLAQGQMANARPPWLDTGF